MVKHMGLSVSWVSKSGMGIETDMNLIAFKWGWPSSRDGLPVGMAFQWGWPAGGDGLPEGMAFQRGLPSSGDGLPEGMGFWSGLRFGNTRCH